MEFNGSHILYVLLVCSLNEASGHLCLNFDHVKDFDVAQFSGTWYSIQTTSPQSKCLVYDFQIQKTEIKKNIENINCYKCINCVNCVDCHYCEDGEDLIGCHYSKRLKRSIGCHYCNDSEDLVGCHHLKNSKGSKGCHNGNNAVNCSVCHNVYDCKNVHNCMNPINCTNIRGLNNPRNIHKVISVKHQFIEALKTDPRSPSKLSVSSTQTADVPEKSPFVVFTTDYQSYAGVYFCRKTANGRKHSVAILSRSQDLDKEKLDSLIEYINYYHEGLKFSTVDHKNCNHNYEAYDAYRSVQNVIGDDEKVDIHISFMSIEDKPEIP